MDEANYDDIIRHTKTEQERQKVKLILDYPGSQKKEVPDPYYGGEDGFQYIYTLLDDACNYHSNQLIKRG
jgi:protein-tyrosine phosphatase